MRIGKAANVGFQLRPQFIDILCCLGEEIAEVEFALRSAFDAVHLELKAPVKTADERAHLHYFALLEQGSALANVVPHARLNLAGAVGENQRKIGGPVLLGADLFLSGNEKGRNRLIFVRGKARYVDVFHLSFERISPTAVWTPVLWLV